MTAVHHAKWKTFTSERFNTRSKRIYFFAVGGISLCSFGIGFLLDVLYDRVESDPGAICISSFIYGIGYLLLTLVAVMYLEAYHWVWTIVSYVICFSLFVLLVSSKGYLVSVYDDIATEHVYISLFKSYIAAAVLEEIVKLVVYAIPLLVSVRYRTIYDLLYYSFISGVTFGTIENLATAVAGPSMALHRFLWCTGTHATDCVSGALVLAYMKSRDKPFLSDKWYWYPLILIVPIVLHGSYDYFIYLARSEGMEWGVYVAPVIGVISIATAICMALPFRRGNIVRDEIPKEDEASSSIEQSLPMCSF